MVRSRAERRRLRAVLRWIRALLPAAALLVAAPGWPPVAPEEDDDVLVVDVDDAAGPLSVAKALVRARRRGGPPDG